MKVIFALILLLGLLLPTDGYALENRDIRFLTIQDGLSDNTVTSILKDRDGFMWFATNNGISRYDGKYTGNFYLPSGEKQQIRHICEANEEYIWVITRQSLYALNRKKGYFLRVIDEKTGNPVLMHRILKAKGNAYWAIYQDKVYSFNLSTITADKLNIHIRQEICSPAKEDQFSSLCFPADSSRIYLITTRLKLMTLSTSSLALSTVMQIPGNRTATTSALVADKQFVWAATGGQGVLRYNLQSGQHQQFIFNENRAYSSLSHESAYALLQISRNTFFVPTWNGYSLLKTDPKDETRVTSDIHDNNSFLDIPAIETRMISAYYDPQHELLWIGTRGGGVLLWDIRQKDFKQYHQKRHNEIISILGGADHRIWLTTYHEGLIRSKEPFVTTDTPLQFEPMLPHIDRNTNISYCNAKDENGDLWFGYSSSLLLHWNEADKRMQSYDLSDYRAGNGKKLGGINSLLVDHHQQLWIGTSHGLFRFDRQSGKCTEAPIHLNGKRQYLTINHISQGRNNDLWIGTPTGLCRVTIQNNRIIQARMGYEKEKQLSPQPVNHTLWDNDEELYVAYSGGFAVFSPAKDSITDFYTTREGLPSNEVNCIAKDADGRIWIGSNSGISRYSRHQKIFYNYFISGSNRSSGAIGNYLFFGSNKSLTYFNPQQLLQTPKTNKVQFTNLEINHQQVSIGKPINSQTVLSKAITFTDTLALNHANRDFSLAFSTLTFNDNKQQYAYRLLPYQRQWVLTHEGEKAVYTSLPEGEYQFEVKAVYPDDVESEVSTLHITISPHWSQSFWFRSLLIALSLLLLSLLLYRIRKKQQRLRDEMELRHQLEIARIEKEKEKEVKEEQEAFFTNAAHELRTPLTLILGPLQDVLNLSPLPETIREKSELALKSARSLLSLTNQLLYVQKIEAGMVKLKLSEANLNELMYQEYLFFTPLAMEQKKEFIIHLPQEPAMLWLDREQIISAIRNLLSNAFKYTPEGGCIELSLAQADEGGKGYSVVTVKDNGSGIPLPLQERVFDSFITGRNIASFSDQIGIGLRIVKNTIDLHHGRIALHSSPGAGSLFTLFLPTGKEHFMQDTVEWVTLSPPEEEQPHTGQPTNPEPEAQHAPKLTLLIIEDNDEIRKYIASLFCKDYRLQEAVNGEEGVQLAKEQLPDLILSDVIMPVKDGFECCREIRSYPQTAHIPIILLTAKAEDADRVHGSLQGADDYIMKPFNPELLKVRVESLIAQRNQLKRIYTKALMLKENSKENDEPDEFIAKIISIIEANLSDTSFKASTIASELNMSQATFFRRLKQHTDLSIVEVIRNIRISKAASLILTQKYPIVEVAEMVGFNDLPTFRKYFVKQFGILPSHYTDQSK